MVWIMIAITVVCVVIVFAIVMAQKEKGTLVKQARAVTKDMVYENAYIVSNDDGRLIFICDGDLYRAKPLFQLRQPVYRNHGGELYRCL